MLSGISPVRISVYLLLAASLSMAVDAHAGSAPGPVVKKNNTVKVPYVATVNGTQVSVNMYCYRGAGGQIQKIGKTKYFVSYAKLLKAAKAKLKVAAAGKQKNKLKKQVALYKVLKADSVAVCGGPGQTSNSLAKYKGPFGLKQAQRLIEVFALGGRPGLADYYVSIGLDAAIEDLTTLKPDTQVDAFRAHLTCGANPWDPDPEDVCYEDDNINDFSMDGVLAGLNWRMIFSNNPAYMKLLQFVMDERAPANPRVLDSEAQWMFLNYLTSVERFMLTGDYKGYVREYCSDILENPVGHGMWLSGVGNHFGILKTGNEDFAREALELVTTGVKKPDGSPVYNDLDIYQNSKVMSGLVISRAPDASGRQVKAVAFAPAFHAPGQKILFAGTPQEMRIDTAADFAREIFVKQGDQIAYELAWRLWRRFINPNGTTANHLQLAQIIKQHDFQLWPVMKAMMASEAFYAPESNDTILKDPNTFYITAARMSGMPMAYWEWTNYIFSWVGMRLGRPGNVFGFQYQNQLLNSDIYQLGRYNGLVYHFLYQNLEDVEERYNWTPYNGMIAGIPLTGDPGRDVVTEIMKRMNLTDSWNAEQKESLEHLINYYLGGCYDPQDPECFTLNGGQVRWYRDAPDMGDVNSDFYRVRLAYLMAATSPEFGSM